MSRQNVRCRLVSVFTSNHGAGTHVHVDLRITNRTDQDLPRASVGGRFCITTTVAGQSLRACEPMSFARSGYLDWTWRPPDPMIRPNAEIILPLGATFPQDQWNASTEIEAAEVTVTIFDDEYVFPVEPSRLRLDLDPPSDLPNDLLP